MQLEDLKTLLESNLQNGTLGLAPGTVDSAAVAGLFTWVVGSDHLSVAGAQIALSDGHLQVSGTASLLGAGNLAVSLVFSESDGGLLLTLDCSLPAGWTIAQGLDGLRGTFFGDLNVSRPALHLTASDRQNEPLRLKLSADVPDLRLSGAEINLVPSVQTFTFNCKIDQALQFPGVSWFSVDNIGVAVSLAGPTKDAVGALSGTVHAGSLALPITIQLPARDDVWLVKADFDQMPLPDFSALAQLVGGSDLDSVVPPQVKALGGLTLTDLEVSVDPTARTIAGISLNVGSSSPLSIVPSTLSLNDVWLALSVIDPAGPGRRLQIGVGGTLQIGEVGIPVGLEYDADGVLRWSLHGVRLTALLQQVLPDVTLPAQVPDVEIGSLECSVTPSSGAFALSTSQLVAWDLGLGGDATHARLTLNVQRTAAANGADTLFDIALTVDELAADQDVTLQNLHFNFIYCGASDWSIDGGVAVVLFDTSMTLGATYQRTAQDTRLLLSELFQPATNVLAVGSSSLSVSSLRIERYTAADSTSSWSVNAAVQLHVESTFSLDGSLTLSRQAGGATGLLIQPVSGALTVPLLPQNNSSMTLSFGDIAIQRAAAASAGPAEWTFSAAAGLGFQNLPPRLLQMFPLADTIQATFQADRHSVELTVDRLLAPVDFQIPDVHISDGLSVPLGKARLDVRNLSVALGKDLQVSADIGVGLPSELNNLFGRRDDGTPAVALFTTFDPSQPDATTVKVQLSASDKGISLTPQSSFIKAIKIVQVDNANWWDCDAGDYGEFRIQTPVFDYKPTDSSFAAAGAFVIIRPLKIPLGLLKRMLGKAGSALPSAMPIRELKLLDANGNLNVEAVMALLPVEAATDDFRKVLRALASVVDLLPDDFKGYLDFDIPQSLSFSIAVSPEGEVRLDINADPQRPLKVLYPTVALLPPWPAPMPVFVGIQLRSLSFGPLAGGSLFLLQVDAIVDQFDLVALGTTLLLPQDGSLPLPTSRALQRRIILEKLFMIIVYETVIPIPIPVFYDQLGLEYLGLEGVSVQAHARFPMPSVNLREATALFSELKQFFTDPHYFLPTESAPAPRDLNLVFSLNRDYLKMPKYLGTRTLGIPGDGPSINLYQTVATVLNSLKRLSLGQLSLDDVLQLIPLENRVGHEQLTFGPLYLGADWLITTPGEFEAGAYRRLATYANQPAAPMQDFNAVIRLPEPTAAAGSKPRGLVAVLQGKTGVDGIVSLDAMFGLAASSTQGFATGFRLTGTIASLLQAEIGGRVSLRLPDPRTSPAAAAPVPVPMPSAAQSLGLFFDGQSTYAEVPSLNLQPMTFTVEWWLNPRSHHDWNQAVGATRQWGAFLCHTTETGAVYVGTDGTTRLTPNEIRDGTIELNQWQHLAFTFDHGTGCFYKNGRLLAARAGMTTPVPWGGFRIGLPTTGTLDGRAADVRVWNRARSAAEIQEGMYRRLAGDEPGLAGCWLCDEGQGSIASDITGQNPATLHGATWAPQGLVRLSGVALDGQTAYIDVPDLTWQPTAFSVEWWLNPRSHHDWNQTLAAHAAWGGFVCHTTETGAVYVGTDGLTRLTPNEIHDGTIELNQWQHLAFTFDRGTGSFYKNGRLVATKTGMTAPLAWNGFSIGLPNTNTLDGLVDEVRIWSRALPVQEIQTYMRKQRLGTEPGLYAYWRFDQVPAYTLNDLTAHAWKTVLNGARGLVTQIPAAVTQSAFQLDGYSHLTLLNHRVFDGDIQITNDRLWLAGQLRLFPPDSPLQVNGSVQGWIGQQEFYLAGDVATSLAGLTLSQARALLHNDRVLLSGTCLGVSSTLDVRQQEQDLVVSGTLRPQLAVSADLGVLRDATHLLAQNVHVDIDATATLDVTIARAGFSASVVASAVYAGKTLSVGPFSLAVAPSDIPTLARELRRQFEALGLQLFRTLFTDADAWLRGVAAGVIQWSTEAYTEMGLVLKEVYGRDIDQATTLLKTVGRGAHEVGRVLSGVYTNSLADASRAMYRAQYSADQVGGALKEVFLSQTYAQIATLRAVGDTAAAQQLEQQARVQATSALNSAGYAVNEVVGTLKNQYGAGRDDVGSVLKQANYSLNVVGDALRVGWPAASSQDIASSLRVARYTTSQVGDYLKTTFNYGPADLGRVLQGGGFPASEIKTFFQSLGGAFTDAVSKLDPTKW